MVRQSLIGSTFRPWNVDALATVVGETPRDVTIRYDHDESQTFTLPLAEFHRIGRVVRRTQYERGKTEAAFEALARLEVVFELEDVA